MSTDEYVPDEEAVREQYSREQPPHIGTVSEKRAELDRFLDRVKRDAAREALDGLINERRAKHEEASSSSRVGGMVLELHAQQVATKYRDTHYPEETP